MRPRGEIVANRYIPTTSIVSDSAANDNAFAERYRARNGYYLSCDARMRKENGRLIEDPAGEATPSDDAAGRTYP